MLIKTVDFKDIRFTYCEYPAYMKASLLKMGLNFPIIVCSEQDYTCVDGHKRLSCIHDILLEDPNHKLNKIAIRFLYGRSQNPKSLQNHH